MAMLSELVAELHREFPHLKISLTDNLPVSNKEAGWIDFPDFEQICIEYIQDKGFGLHLHADEEVGFGEHPDEVYQDIPSVVKRIREFGGLFHHTDK